MTKKEKRQKAKKEMTIDVKEIAIRRGRQAARAEQVHRDKTKYNRACDKERAQKEE